MAGWVGVVLRFRLTDSFLFFLGQEDWSGSEESDFEDYYVSPITPNGFGAKYRVR